MSTDNFCFCDHQTFTFTVILIYARCFVNLLNSLFSLVLIFPSFWVKPLRSQTLLIGGSVWNKKCKCQRNAHVFERNDHSFGFPQIVHAHDCFVESPNLRWHKSMAMCRSWSQRDTCLTQCVARGPSPTNVQTLV